jgi:CheY-like chemotaxis protein
MKLLIIEDNPQMRRMIRNMVEDLAESIAECSDGEEAVAVYAAHRFDGDDRVLMDLQMPRVGGLEATRRIREAFPDAGIIIVTQFDDPQLRAAAIWAGACGYVSKENLLELRRLLQSSCPTRPLSVEECRLNGKDKDHEMTTVSCSHGAR